MGELAEINADIKRLEVYVANKKQLDSLKKNKAFNSLITEGYFIDRAAELVLLKARLGHQSEEEQNYIQKQIDAIGHFHNYLNDINATGVSSNEALASAKEVREVIMKEGE